MAHGRSDLAMHELAMMVANPSSTAEDFAAAMDSVLAEKLAGLLEGNRTAPPCLVLAAARGRADLVATMLSRGAHVNVRDAHHGMTALHAAARLNDEVCARLLVTAKADVDARDSQGLTPAHYAALSGCVRPLAVLLESGANANAQSKSRSTPLHASCAKGNRECAMLLLRSGASPTARDSLLRTPSSYAARNGFPQLASMVEAETGETSCAETAKPRRLRIVPRRSPKSPTEDVMRLASPSVSVLSSVSTMVTASPFPSATAELSSSLATFRLPPQADSSSQRVYHSPPPAGSLRHKRSLEETGDDDAPLSSSGSLVEPQAKRLLFCSEATMASSHRSPTFSIVGSLASGCVADESQDVGLDWF
jgi:hypothetical protein